MAFPRYIFSWWYHDGQTGGIEDVRADKVNSIEEASLAVKRRIAKRLSCFPVQVRILDVIPPAIKPPKKPRSKKRGRPFLFQGETEKTCLTMPKSLAAYMRHIGGGYISQGFILIAEEFMKNHPNISVPDIPPSLESCNRPEGDQ